MSALALQSFGFEGNTVRVLNQDGAPWFVAQDVCAVLELTNPSKVTATLDDDEKGITSADTLGGEQQVLIVSESGLYALIFKSRKPEAIRFRKWVTSEVLPTLRRTGSFVLEAANDDSDERFVLDSPEKIERVRTEVLMMRIAQQARGRDGLQRMYTFLGWPSIEEARAPHAATRQLWRVAASVIAWAAERLVEHDDGPRGRFRLREAHADYEAWCAERCDAPVSLVAFGKAMPSIGINTTRSDGSWIVGSRLAD